MLSSVLSDVAHNLQIGLPMIAIAFLVASAYTDLKDRIIPNRFSLSLFLLFPAYTMTGPISVDVLSHLSWGMLSLLILLPLFAYGKMGGGDVKLIAATATWCGPISGPEFIILTALAGGAMALLVLSPVIRIFLIWGQAVLGLSTVSLIPEKETLPYGVAISIGGVFAIYQAYLG